MECGRHKLSLECETLYDRAMLGYASRLEHGTTAAPELGKAEFFPSFSASSLPMGWAPKCSLIRSIRSTVKQEEYLNAKF